MLESRACASVNGEPQTLMFKDSNCRDAADTVISSSLNTLADDKLQRFELKSCLE